MIFPKRGVSVAGGRQYPDWFPSDPEIVDYIAARQAIYRFYKPKYQLQLLKDLALLLPPGNCRVLDVGAGSGLIAHAIATFFPGKSVVAVDVVNRVLPTIGLSFRTFDGLHLPFEDSSFDCVLLCNVLHHVRPHMRHLLLDESLRVVGRGAIVIKDHRAESRLDRLRLAFLDCVGNAPFGGMVYAEYLSKNEWDALLARAHCLEQAAMLDSPYRTGLYGHLFPNRLEVSFRITSSRTAATKQSARIA